MTDKRRIEMDVTCCGECPYCVIVQDVDLCVHSLGPIRVRRGEVHQSCPLTKVEEAVKDSSTTAELDLSLAHRIVESWPQWKRDLAKKILRPSIQP